MSKFWAPSYYTQCWYPTYSKELYHFGVKGMRWGIRHDKEPIGGRNKPTDGRDHYELWVDAGNVADVASNTAKAASSGNLLKTAAGVATLATGAAGIVKTKASEVRTSRLETDSETGMKLKDPSKTWSQEEDMKAVNPMHMNLMSTGARNNCMLCSMTYDLRRRGYDVTANVATYGYDISDISRYYPGSSTSECYANVTVGPDGGYYITEEDYSKYEEETIKDMLATGEGSRGIFCVMWSQGGGHAMAYEIHDGKPIIYDCQTGKKCDPKEILPYTYESHVTRTDNVEPNKELIKEVTRSK